MKNILIAELIDNTYFDAPVYLDENYILLTPDTPVTSDLNRRLDKWGYTGVYSDGKPKDSPAFESSEDHVAATAILDSDIKEKTKIDSSRSLYYSVINFIKEIFKTYKQNNTLDIAPITEKVKELIQTIKTDRDYILRFPEFHYPSENYIYRHSVNNAVLALCLGELLKLPPHRMIELGIAALLHDIGMLKIPDEVYLNSQPLSPGQRKIVNAHTVLGYKILRGFSVADDIALTALEHHERLDGSGYPQRLKADKISLFSKIIAITCSYEAIISERPFKHVMDGHKALLELLKSRQKLYDENIIRALIYSISLYPIGTAVLLSNGAIARVVKTNPENPKLPVVQILVDQEAKPIEEYLIVKTSQETEITIKRTLTTEEAKHLKPVAKS